MYFTNSWFAYFYSQQVKFGLLQSKPVCAQALQPSPSDCVLLWITFKVLFPGPWWPASKRSPHSCSSISNHCCWLTPGQLMESSPGSPCAAPQAASIILSPRPSSYIFWAPISLSSPIFLSINPLPLELPSDSTSRLVIEIACKIILECYKHC